MSLGLDDFDMCSLSLDIETLNFQSQSRYWDLSYKSLWWMVVVVETNFSVKLWLLAKMNNEMNWVRTNISATSSSSKCLRVHSFSHVCGTGTGADSMTRTTHHQSTLSQNLLIDDIWNLDLQVEFSRSHVKRSQMDDTGWQLILEQICL